MDQVFLDKVKAAGFDLNLYMKGMSLVYQSKVIDILRENGRVFPVAPDAENYVAYQAAVANWSVGFNTALDQLLNFAAMLNVQAKEQPLADFGGLEKAVAQGNLTKEESDAIRTANVTDLFKQP